MTSQLLAGRTALATGDSDSVARVFGDTPR